MAGPLAAVPAVPPPELSLCEKEFARIGLSFWTGGEEEAAVLDSHTAASVGDLHHLLSLPLPTQTAENRTGWTPLMLAAYHGHTTVVAHLAGSGQDALRAANQRGRTALVLAAMCGQEEVVEQLLQADPGPAQLAAVDERNMTGLSHAVAWGHLATAELLIRAGSCPDQTEHRAGHSLLMMSAQAGHTRMVELLLRGPYRERGYQSNRRQQSELRTASDQNTGCCTLFLEFSITAAAATKGLAPS